MIVVDASVAVKWYCSEDGSPKAVTATTNPANLNVTIGYSQNGHPFLSPTDAGTYDVTATGNLPSPRAGVVTIGADNVLWEVQFAPGLKADTPVAVVIAGDGDVEQVRPAEADRLRVPGDDPLPGGGAEYRQLGVARVIDRRTYAAGRAANQLRRLLGNPIYRTRAAAIGKRVGAEDGVAAACDAIELQLDRLRS